MDLSKLTAAVAETEKAFREMEAELTKSKGQLHAIERVFGAVLTKAEGIDAPKAPVVSPRVAKGKRGRKPKFSDAEVQGIQRGRRLGLSIALLAKKYKATPPTIYAALKRAAANGSGAGRR